MYVLCDRCRRAYDDAARWTICPHSPLGCAVDDLCPKCDTLRSRHGPCEHQLATDAAKEQTMSLKNENPAYPEEPKAPTIAAAEAIMTPTLYQRLAARTETIQENALSRISCSTVPTLGLDNGDLSLVPVRALHAAVGIGNEAGELFSLLQKWLWYGKPLDVANAKEELGDLMWYAAQLCNALGFDLGDVMRCNIAKLKARYPEKYTDEKATSRDRDAERRAMEGLNFMAPGFVGEAPVPPIDADNSHRTTPLDPTKPALCQYCPETATCLVEWFKGPAGGKRGPVTVHWCGKCSLKDALAKRGMIAPVREGEDYRVLPLGVAKAEPSSERGTPDGQGLVKGGTVGGE